MSFASRFRRLSLAVALPAPLCVLAVYSCGGRNGAEERAVEAAARRAANTPRLERHAQFLGAPQPFSGHYLGYALVPCGSTARLWLSADSHQTLAPHVARLLGSRALEAESLPVPLFVRVLAVSSSQDPAHPNAGDDGGLSIRQLITVRIATEHDCPQ